MEAVQLPTHGITQWTQVTHAVINTLILVVTVAAVIGIIYGGYQYITSQGNPDAAKTAKLTLLASIIAVVLSGSAYIIINFVYSNIFL